MSLADCAALVKQADEDRFLSVMAAKPEQRAALFALYAFNIEISKAAWASAEPMLCQMRLQYLRDLVDAIYAGGVLPHSPVAKPLADVIETGGIPQQKLVEMIEVRTWDIERQAFDNTSHFNSYLQKTAGNLMMIAASATGGRQQDLDAIQAHGRAMGLAKFLIAVPDFMAHGCKPLLDESPQALAALASAALQQMQAAKIPQGGHAAVRAGFDTKRVLRRVSQQPERVLEGRLQTSPFRRKSSLLVMSLFG